MDVQLSTSWILDNSIYLTWLEDEQNLLYCISRRMPSYLKLKNFIYYYQLTLVKV